MTLAIALGAAITACSTDSRSASPTSEPSVAPSGLPLVRVTITSGTRVHRFTVELARTSEEQAHGLMNRTTLAPDAGMLFPFDPPQDATFWMKDTLIPLDMLFVRYDGTIVAIETAKPLSLDAVSSGQFVAAVLEIAGGRAAQLGIKPGDRVDWTG